MVSLLLTFIFITNNLSLSNASAKDLENPTTFEFVDSSGTHVKIELYDKGTIIIGKQYILLTK